MDMTPVLLVFFIAVALVVCEKIADKQFRERKLAQSRNQGMCPHCGRDCGCDRP